MLFLTFWQSIYYSFFSNFKYRHPSASCLQHPLHPLEVLYIPTFTLCAVIPKHIFLVFKSPGLQKLHCLDIYTWSVVTSHTKYLKVKNHSLFSLTLYPLLHTVFTVFSSWHRQSRLTVFQVLHIQWKACPFYLCNHHHLIYLLHFYSYYPLLRLRPTHLTGNAAMLAVGLPALLPPPIHSTHCS